VLHVHDLADYASSESGEAGSHIVDYLNGKRPPVQGRVEAGANLRYVAPNRFIPGEDMSFYMRSMVVEERAVLEISVDGKLAESRKLKNVAPPEMLNIRVPGKLTAAGGILSFSLRGEEA